MIWLIVAAVLFGLTWLPVGVRAIYRENAPGVWLTVGPLKFTLYPEKSKKTKEEKASETKSQKKKEQGGSYGNFLPIFRAVVEFLSHFRKKLRVKRLEMKLTLAGDDPADLAVNYGRAWGAVGALLPQLERFLTIKNRDVAVLCDFEGDKTRIYARIDATIALGNFLYLLSRHGLKIFKDLIHSKNLQKGGAQL